VTGLEAYLVDADACAAELRSKLACSTSVGELPGKNNPGREVVCQGAVVEKVAEHLMANYGIPKKAILAKTA
jgi:translation initiation factor 2D